MVNKRPNAFPQTTSWARCSDLFNAADNDLEICIPWDGGLQAALITGLNCGIGSRSSIKWFPHRLVVGHTDIPTAAESGTANVSSRGKSAQGSGTDISAFYREFTNAMAEVLAENAVGPARRGRLA